MRMLLLSRIAGHINMHPWSLGLRIAFQIVGLGCRCCEGRSITYISTFHRSFSFGAVQGSLKEMITNFESDRRASFFAELYDKCNLPGGHAILLDQRPATRWAAGTPMHQELALRFGIFFACSLAVLQHLHYHVDTLPGKLGRYLPAAHEVTANEMLPFALPQLPFELSQFSLWLQCSGSSSQRRVC